MGKEALSLHILGMEEDAEEIPAPTPVRDLKLDSGQVPALIDVWMPSFRERMSSKAVGETVTLP